MKCASADVCFIITGGECDVSQLKNEDVFVIACDKGYEYCKQARIIPCVIIGDFDSYDGTLPAHIKTVHLPHEKNDSDTQYAFKYAYDIGCRTFHVYGALGGRFDHTFANIQSAVKVVQKGASVTIYGKYDTVYIIDSSCLTLKRAENCFVSVLSYTAKCTGVTLKGLYYPLINAVLYNNYPLGLSNEFISDTAEISVKKGTLIVTVSHNK